MRRTANLRGTGSIPVRPSINRRAGLLAGPRSATPMMWVRFPRSAPFCALMPPVAANARGSAVTRRRTRSPRGESDPFADLVFVARAFGFQPNEASSTLAIRTNSGVRETGNPRASKTLRTWFNSRHSRHSVHRLAAKDARLSSAVTRVQIPLGGPSRHLLVAGKPVLSGKTGVRSSVPAPYRQREQA